MVIVEVSVIALLGSHGCAHRWSVWSLVPVVVFFVGVVMVLFEVVSSCVFLSIAVGVFLAGVFEGVGGRGFDISSLLLPPSPEAGRPNQLSSAHRQGPGVDTATAGGPRPPPSYHCL